MKKTHLILLFCTVLFSSCIIDDDDSDTISRTFETNPITFFTNNNLTGKIQIPIPNNLEVFEADVPLVYVLDPKTSQENGRDAWEPLPRKFNFEDGGFAQYRFNFIFDAPVFSIEIILETDDFSKLNADFTQNQRFRIVLAPSEFLARTNIDLTDYDAVSKALAL